MSTVNLQALIDQVLGMTKETLALRNKKLDEGLSGHEQTEARNYEIQKEQNKNTAAQTLQAQENEAAFARQGLVNTGQLEQAKERTAGEIARQGLANEGTRYSADKGLEGHIYTADTNYAMKRDELSKGYDPELIKAHAAVIANVNSSPEAVASSQAAIDWYTKNAMKKQSQARQGLVDEQPAPAAAIPAPATPAATKPAFSLNDLTEPVGSTLVNGIAGKNPPTDFNDFKISKPTAPQKTTPSTPATGLGGSIGRGWYGFTHPDEPVPFQGVRSPLRKGLDQTVFTDAPKAVADTARGAVEGVQDFGRNAALGYEQRKAEEAKKKRKALY